MEDLQSELMPGSIQIQPVSQPIHGSIRPPGSKSLTNRGLLIASLADGKSVLHGALDSDDTRVMVASLRQLGISVDHNTATETITVYGNRGHFENPAADLFVDNSGTTIRFLTAVLAMAGGQYVLDGVARMRQRPIGPLTQALTTIGANVVAESANDCPPVRISSSRLPGGLLKLRGDISSQYLSGLLMAAPLASEGIAIEIDGPLISKPYVIMTLEVMKAFGVECQHNAELSRFEVLAGQTYLAREYRVEPDASAASYFWAAAAICGGQATVVGLNQDSLQGDVGFAGCLQAMGCEVSFAKDAITVTGPAKHGIDVDMSDISDTVQTLAAVALFVDGQTRVRNVAHNRVKETDRIGNLAIELRKFGVQVNEYDDGLAISRGPMQGAVIETYNDHRMAMSLALVGLKQPGVVIENPGCVSKTYPNYFRDLKDFVK